MFMFTHRNPEMQLVKNRTALVLADIQNEFLQPSDQPRYHALIEDALKKRNVIANLEALLRTAQELGYFVIHSPHWYYPTDGQWTVRSRRDRRLSQVDRVLRSQGSGRSRGLSWVQGRLLRALQEVPDGRPHLQRRRRTSTSGAKRTT